MSDQDKFEATHSFFFTGFNTERNLEDIPADDELATSFIHNLASVISVLEIPIALSKTRAAFQIFEGHRTQHAILNAVPQIPGTPDEEYEAEQAERTEESLKVALDIYLEEMKTPAGIERFWNRTYGFLEVCLENNNELQAASKELLKQGIVLLWSSLEVLVRDFAIREINKCPEIIRDVDVKSVPLETLARYHYDVKDRLGEIFAEQRDWSNYSVICEVLKRICPKKVELHKKMKAEDLYGLSKKRHLIVHRRGIIDRQYKEETREKGNIGDALDITPAQLKQGLNMIKEIGVELLQVDLSDRAQ